jgi:hypothetical protein
VPADRTVGIYDLAWDSRQTGGGAVTAGVYFVRAAAPSVGFHSERRIVMR